MGEGLKTAAAVLCIGLAGAAFVWWGDRLQRGIDQFFADEPTEADLTAQAMVPEYAAAVQRCGCQACQRLDRVKSPCSDFDED